MHIFFPSTKKGSFFYIKEEEFKHLKVRRIKKGEEIGIIWEGNIYKCVLKEINKKEALCEIKEIVESEKPVIDITLIQAVTIELKTFDMIVQKATELGVKRIIPLITERSFRNIDAIEKRAQRWTKISKEAMKQAGRPYTLRIDSPIFIENLHPQWNMNILLDNFYNGKYICELSFKNLKSVGVVVGPEGGFSQKEATTLRDRGFISVKLKPHVLRAETAAIISVGIIMNLACL